eukprot:g31629.t2
MAWNDIALQALRHAVEQQQPSGLREALAEAVAAGSGWELIEWAHDKCRELEHEAWKEKMQQAAMAALHKVQEQPRASAEALSDACEQAWQAGVPEKALELALAEEALLSVLHERNFSTELMEQLEKVIQQAEKAAVSSDLVNYAFSRLEEIRNHVCPAQREKLRQKQEVTRRASHDLSDFNPVTAADMIPVLDAALTAGVPREICRMPASKFSQRAFSSKAWASQLGADPDAISVDRRFLAGESSQMVVLHDYRDMKFLQRLSAAALFGTLMSSSGLAYALSLGWPAEHCLAFVFQMVVVPLFANAYLRTYIARAVLDPKRSQLLITGCTWFGVPRTTEDVIFLDQMRPGHALEGGYIKFRGLGPAWDVSRWIWFRLPRGGHGSENVRPGQQVGHRPKSSRPAEPAGLRSSNEKEEQLKGLGVTQQDSGGFAAPRAPQKRQVQEKPLRRGPRKAIQALKLQGGLPASSQEEQKLFDFFEEPAAYGIGMQ